MHSVLFVDDEKSILNSIDRIFIDSDIRVLWAENAQKALGYYQQGGDSSDCIGQSDAGDERH